MYSQNWNCAAPLFTKQNYAVLSSNSSTHTPVRDLYIAIIGLHIWLQPNIWSNPWNTWIAHRHMIVGIRTEAAQFLFWEYINWIFGYSVVSDHNSAGSSPYTPVRLRIVLPMVHGRCPVMVGKCLKLCCPPLLNIYCMANGSWSLSCNGW